ncbi:cytochrome c3 family protein [Gemmatimonadota bacterium]
MRVIRASMAVVLAIGMSLAHGDLLAQDDAMCLMCHGNAAMFAGVEGGERLVLTPQDLAESVHGRAGLSCAMCHQDLALPHTAADVPPVDCGGCHSAQATQHARSLHGQAASRGDPLAPSCTDCHGSHDILSHTDPRSPTRVINIPLLCGECHQEGSPVSRTHDIPQDRILENYSMSIHGEGLFRAGLTVTAVCTSCHTSHNILDHTDPRSSIHRDNVAETCQACHTQIEQVHVQVIEGRLWEEEPHKVPACVDCHAPHQQRRVFYDPGAANEDCLSCHRDPSLTGFSRVAGDTVSLYVDEQAYQISDHNQTACAQCHTDVTPGLARACETSTEPVDCSICHADVVLEHQSSTHGQLVAEGSPDAPTCQDCHTKHSELDRALPASPTFPRNVPELCSSCHREGEVAATRIAHVDYDISSSYEMSIHGKGLFESGLLVTATCTSCHTAHNPLPESDPQSSVYPDNVAATCGACHHGIEEDFRTSVHFSDHEVTEDGRELPTCEDCHTSHEISRTDQGDFRLMMMNQCGRCHEEESETFFETFHGKVSRLGDAGAAKCYDCHGTHNILPITNPESMLSRANIVETCSICHPSANERFTGYLTHATHHDSEKYPWLFWSFWAMTTLLVGTLTFFAFHTLAWLFRLWRSPEHWKQHHRPFKLPPPDAKLYRRFTTFERSLHGAMLISFFVLALTGMILKFSYMGWAQLGATLVGGFATTGVLHRLGAITLTTVWLIHIFDALKRKRRSGKTWLEFINSAGSLLPNMTDVREFIGSMKWFLGFGPRPEYGRFTYWEKFDYMAVFWGMFVIGSTGLLLWFPEFFTLFLPGKSVNIATIVHSDEALLAVGFIFTVHFFNTHFRPDKFPMDPVIFTGRVTLDEFKVDKPREYQELVDSGELESHLVAPYPRNIQIFFRVIGFTALFVGLTLIALIVYSMLFGYR